MSFSMSNTKAQLLVAICELENQNMRQAHDLADLRTQISVLQGELRLRPRALQPQVQNRIVTLRGVEHEVIVERSGQRTTKRFVSLSTV